MKKHHQITSAMILAAGLGNRIRSANKLVPKPLIKVAGRELIEYSISNAIGFGINQLIVNTHYKADLINSYLQTPHIKTLISSRSKKLIPLNIKTIYEIKRLETGGGVRNALTELGYDPFFVMNSDSIFGRTSFNPLSHLARAWDSTSMDALLLVCPLNSVRGYSGLGDFALIDKINRENNLLDRNNKIVGKVQRWTKNKQGAALVFTGVQILSPSLFNNAPNGPYSLNTHYDEAISRQRLFAMKCDEIWYHVGTPAGLKLAENNISD